MTFPIYIRLGSLRIHPHALFEILAFALAFAVFICFRGRRQDHLSDDLRWWVITAGLVGAALGSRLLGWMETPHVPVPGKTVVGGIVGGILAVELGKRQFGVKTATGDLFAIPISIGIGVGRIGCFLTGLADDTFGTVTSLPWGVDFGDGMKRHPVQIYEILFLCLLVPMLTAFWRRQSRQGDTFKVFVSSYMAWRLFVDFFKPENLLFGFSIIQLTCLFMLIYYSRDLLRIARSLAHGEALAES